MEGRNESGRTISGPNTTVGRKGGGHSGGSTTIGECSTTEQAMVRSEGPLTATEK